MKRRNWKAVQLLIIAVVMAAMSGCAQPPPAVNVGALQTASTSIELGDAEAVQVEINIDAGQLDVAGGADGLLEADFAYNVAELKPGVAYDDGTLTVAHPDVNVGIRSLWDLDDYRSEWDLRLNDSVPMAMHVDFGAGTATLNLGTLSLTSLDMNTGTGEVAVDLSGAAALTTLNVEMGAGKLSVDLSGDWQDDLDAVIKGGAGSMTLQLPRNVGVRVVADTGLGPINANGLNQDGDVYTNDAYSTSAVALRIDVEGGIGEINLDVVEPTQAEKPSAAQQNEVDAPDANAPDAPAQPDLDAALQGLVDAQVQEQGILGMAMAVRAPDGTVISAGSGYSDHAGENAWTVDTQSAIASVTKSFTSVVIAQLIEEGKLSLDDTIDAWFPEQPNGDKITVRMLLSHTSGLNKYINGPDEMQAGKFAPEWAPLDLVAKANEAGPVDEPGSSDAHYANANYVLLGLITEELTGNSWAQEVEARIIQSLDLQSTTFLSAEGVLDTMVGGYAKTEDGYQNLLEESWYPHASTFWSAGEIVTSASDLLTFASALFDGDLVSPETLAVMAEPVGTDVDDGILWGLGGGTIEGLPGGFGMGGDIPGYHAFFMGFLDTKFVAVTMVNTDEGDAIGPSMAAMEYLSSLQSGAQKP